LYDYEQQLIIFVLSIKIDHSCIYLIFNIYLEDKQRTCFKDISFCCCQIFRRICRCLDHKTFEGNSLNLLIMVDVWLLPRKLQKIKLIDY